MPSPRCPLPEGAEIINGEAVVHGTVEKGDTVSKIIEGNTSSGSHPYVSAARQVFSMRAFRTGQPYTIVVDPASGQLKRFEYEIDASRRLVVEGAEEPVARVEPIEYVTTLAQVEATIDDNLFQAVADIGESPQLAPDPGRSVRLGDQLHPRPATRRQFQGAGGKTLP